MLDDDVRGITPGSNNKPLNEITLKNGSLLSSTTRVEAPFVRVKIGDFSFGVYEGKQAGVTHNGIYKTTSEKFPDYIKSMEVKKINGAVNTYTINLSYPINFDSDPNFFEKIFSSISDSRKITIEYGDFNMVNYIYKDEEAIIINVDSQFDIKTSVINYTIKAVSSTKLTLANVRTFPGFVGKPSDKIKEVIKDKNNHLLEVFTGMNLGNIDDLIDSSDKGNVDIPTMTNISALDYIAKLASYMTPVGRTSIRLAKNSAAATAVKQLYKDQTYDQIIQDGFYVVNTFESADGPYLKVQKIERNSTEISTYDTYTIDIGYPTANIITEFSVDNGYNWSIYYDYVMENNSNNYVKRIDDQGKEVKVYSPLLTGTRYNIDDADKSWWTRVTEFPISAKIVLKGLLKPAILMSYVKLNVWFYGRKHVASGTYIITSHTDNISESGYFTTLTLLRVAGDDGFGY